MKKFKKFLIVLFCILLMVGAGYVLFLAMYPRIYFLFYKPAVVETNPTDTIVEASPGEPEEETPATTEKFLIIPKLGLNEKIYQDESGLDRGIWHKYSDSSDPVIGGNFVLVGHRFNFGLTPEETKRKSPLYNINELAIGDEIQVSWNGKMYKYLINEKFKVNPNQVEIEENTPFPQLLLYTCTLEGRYDGREVVIAKPIHNRS